MKPTFSYLENSLNMITNSPLKTRSYAFGRFSVDVSGVRGGGFSLLQLSGTQTNKQLLELKGANGAVFPSELRVTIVRVQ